MPEQLGLLVVGLWTMLLMASWVVMGGLAAVLVLHQATHWVLSIVASVCGGSVP